MYWTHRLCEASGGAVWKADAALVTFVGYDFSPWNILAPARVGLAVFTYYPAARYLFLGAQLARRGVANAVFSRLDNVASHITGRARDAH